MFSPNARYKGIVNVNGKWVAQFSAGYRVKILPKKSQAKEEIWKFARTKFLELGIPMIPSEDSNVAIQPEPAAKTG